MPRGVSREEITQKEHLKLLEDKYKEGQKKPDHITLFRVPDKTSLPETEIRAHTVPGPKWTPSSSVAFVEGALAANSRIWVTQNSEQSFVNNNNQPSILAREQMAVHQRGYVPRLAAENETYGVRTNNKSPEIVYTPPDSPLTPRTPVMQNLYNTNSSFEDFNTTPSKLNALATPIEDSNLVKFLKQNKAVNLLIRQGQLSSQEIDLDAHQDLLENEDIITLLESVRFSKLLETFQDIIEESDADIGDYNFVKLFKDLNISISKIIELYDSNHQLFYRFATDKFISFFNEYKDDIELEELIQIYNDNRELFEAMITDPDDILELIEVQDFIEKFEEIQGRIDQINEHDIYLDTAYKLLANSVIEDGCPEGLLSDVYSSSSSMDSQSDTDEIGSCDDSYASDFSG